MASQCDIVILAAGASTRLGRPKQSLSYHDGNLLSHAINTALASQAKNIIVVLAVELSEWNYAAAGERLQKIINKNWQEGIASSIRCGLNFVLNQNPATENVLFMTCDQPFINTSLLDNLINLQWQSGVYITATSYEDVKGIPAVFGKSLFAKLLQLKGDSGARKIIATESQVNTVDFPLAVIDIDTEADYKALQKREANNDN